MRKVCDAVCADTLRLGELSVTIDAPIQYANLLLVPFIGFHHYLMILLGTAIVFFCKPLFAAYPM